MLSVVFSLETTKTLTAARGEQIFIDRASGKLARRPAKLDNDEYRPLRPQGYAVFGIVDG